jgi:hypothetical protein
MDIGSRDEHEENRGARGVTIQVDDRGGALLPRSDDIPALRAARVNRTEWLQG